MSRQPLKTYLRLCSEFYDLDKPMLTGGQEYAFFLSYAQAARGPILEPMCGTGRFLIPMLLAGLPVEGFDASEHMLHTLRQKYASFNNGDAPVSLQFVQDFQSAKRFALIFVPFGSWGLITDLAEAKKSIAVMFAHLAKGGTLLLEIETIFSVPEPCGIWRRGVHVRPDGSRIAVNALATYTPSTQLYTSVCQYESLVNGQTTEVEVEHFEQYLYGLDELDAILLEVGFRDIKKYQDYLKTPAVDAQAPKLLYECMK